MSPATTKDIPVAFVPVGEKNVMQLKKLNSVIFPVRYHDKFYKDAAASGDLAKLAIYGDMCVGGVATRIELQEGGRKRLYIMTLGVLAPYRRLGIGAKLLRECLQVCDREPSIEEVYLHVQTSNDVAIDFYREFGFEITGTIPNYYQRIQPPDCHILSKSISQPPVKNGTLANT